MLSLYQSGVWYLWTRHAPLVKSVRSQNWPCWGLAWACSAGWEEVSSAKGSNYSWGEQNHVDGEDPWLMKVEEGRSCSTRPEATRAVEKSPTNSAPWPLGALGRTQNWRGGQKSSVLVKVRGGNQFLNIGFCSQSDFISLYLLLVEHEWQMFELTFQDVVS